MGTGARRSLTATAVVMIVALALLMGGGWYVHNLVARSFRMSQHIRSARAYAAQVLRNQLDEETGLRGYAATHEAMFLEPYDAGHRALADSFNGLRRETAGLALFGVAPDIADAAAASAAWNKTVAFPLLRSRPRNVRALEVRGKSLMDRFRDDIANIETAIDARERAADTNVQAGIDRFAMFVGGSVALLGVLALVFLMRQSRLASGLELARTRADEARRRSAELRAAYLVEKRISDTLQDAFSQRALPTLPTLRFSATYVPATEETKVGGDWYDALELPAGRVLFAIGDVAGHGIDAAVSMNRARQALISVGIVGRRSRVRPRARQCRIDPRKSADGNRSRRLCRFENV